MVFNIRTRVAKIKKKKPRNGQHIRKLKPKS